MDTTINESNAPLMKFVDKTERNVIVTTIDSCQKIWIRFTQDDIIVITILIYCALYTYNLIFFFALA